jgi:hypothetical protein
MRHLRTGDSLWSVLYWGDDDGASEATEGARWGLVPKKDVVRWIGIFFDRKLSFNHDVCTKLASARRTFVAMSTLVRHETGLSPSATRQLYQACVIPRSDYRAEIWWNKQWNLERQLQQLQNDARRRILNAFKSTPIPALHNGAARPLVSVRLDSEQHKYALSLLTLPASHPVAQRCLESFPILNHPAPQVHDHKIYHYPWQSTRCPPSRLIQSIQHMRPWLHPDEVLEDTAHLTTSPWTQSPIKVDIAAVTKTDAAITHAQLLLCLQRNPHNIIVYTDGWQLANNTGAGYCIPMGLPLPVQAIVPMGETTEVFDAELRAIYEALLTCQRHIRRGCLHRRNIHIFTDNQLAIT